MSRCWRSLSIKSDRQLKSKIGEINKLMAHIHVLLICFHMYWLLSILQDIHMKYMGKYQKGATEESVKEKGAKEPSKSPSKSQFCAGHRRGQGLGPPRN